MNIKSIFQRAHVSPCKFKNQDGSSIIHWHFPYSTGQKIRIENTTKLHFLSTGWKSFKRIFSYHLLSFDIVKNHLKFEQIEMH